LKVANRRAAAHEIVTFDLVDPSGAPLPEFAAGAHVDVRTRDGLIRQYSLSNDPAERHRYRLGVLLDPNSRGGSTAIHAGFAEDEVVEVGVPRNLFPVRSGSDPSLLFGGGIGITPLLSMAYEVEAAGRAFALHYCVRDRSRAAYIDEIESGRLAPNTVLHLDDGPAEQRLDVAALLAEANPKTTIYVCGPGGFINYVLDAARRCGWSEDRLHSESFASSADLDGDSFEIIAERSGLRLVVPAGTSAATVLLEAGVDVSVSCEQGICGACLTDVIEGVPDHRDLVQSEEEKATNKQVALCCSRSFTPILRIDI
jgi:ferredoxin-NADP reductase